MLVMLVVAIALASCYSLIITGMQARLMGYRNIIGLTGTLEIGKVGVLYCCNSLLTWACIKFKSLGLDC